MKLAVRVRVIAMGVVFAFGCATVAEARSHSVHGKVTASGRSPALRSVLRNGAAFAAYEPSYDHHAGKHRTRIVTPASQYGRLASWGRHGRGVVFGRRPTLASGLQCVTFARADSGIEISGNASAWWDHAAGIYQRGSRPEPGSVLNFRANGAMRMGHVAVVDQVIDSRTIVIDHANWGGPGTGSGRVSRAISVVDVSPDNDWSAVRVGLGHSGEYGSIYPTYGFIYNRPDPGIMVASVRSAAPIPPLNPAPRDLRGRVSETVAYDEVAEAPESSDVATFRRTAYGHHHKHAARHHRHHNTLL